VRWDDRSLAVETAPIVFRELLYVPCGRIIALITQLEALEPFLSLLRVFGGLLGRDNALDDDELGRSELAPTFGKRLT
jgi:hypothetical protein